MKSLKYENKTTQPDINRRNFIYSGLSLTVAGSFVATSNVRIQKTQEEKLLSILNTRSSISIGLALMNTSNNELHTSNLIKAILSRLGLSPDTLNSITTNALSTRLKQQTINDFDSGLFINASGWILGLTEAQLCSLAAQKYTRLTAAIKN